MLSTCPNAMMLTASFKTARDLLAKLDRDFALLKDEASSDRFFNFVVTAYSLCDWIKNDPSVPAAAKADLERFRAQQKLLVCRDVTNASKHFELDERSQAKSITDRVDSSRGYGVGRFGIGPYGVGEEQITLRFSDRTAFGVLEFAADVLSAWQSFLTCTPLRI